MSDGKLIQFNPVKKVEDSSQEETPDQPEPTPRVVCNEGPGQPIPSLYQMKANVLSPQAPPQMVLVEYVNVRPKYEAIKTACGRFAPSSEGPRVCGSCIHAVPEK